MSGRIDAASTALITAMPLIKARKVRALAIMNEERTAVLPALATVSRQGIPGYNYAAWFGFGAPAATCSSIKKVCAGSDFSGHEFGVKSCLKKGFGNAESEGCKWGCAGVAGGSA